MKRVYLFIFGMIVPIVAFTQTPTTPVIYQDCSKNGVTADYRHNGSAPVNSSAGRTSCEWVQLWENGPKWATFNMGATITDYANLTVGVDPTSFNNNTEWAPYYNTANVGGLYAWMNPNHNGRKTTWDVNVSTGISDVATTLWGSNWKTPTKAQLDTLKNSTYTTWTWCDSSTTQYVKGCILEGWKVTGKGNYAQYSIFLPAAGFFDFDDGMVYSPGTFFAYWSSTDADMFPYLLYYNIIPAIRLTGEGRKFGFPVRAVLAQ